MDRIPKKMVWWLALLALVLTRPTQATIHDVDIDNFFFSPANTVVNVGDTVRWTWVSGTHSTTSEMTSPKSWDSGVKSAGSFELVILPVDGPGPFPYLCSVHPVTMKDTIWVSPTNDADSDGIPDINDKCPFTSNPAQLDADGDGFGDVCDICPGFNDLIDTDGDGFPAGCDCDDADGTSFPGAVEIPDDGIDQDCDGFDLVTTCCVLRVGDANGLGGDEPTIGDVSVLIDAKFITGTCVGILMCFTEADINQSGGSSPTCDDVTIGDISILIDYLFITGSSLGLQNCL